MLALVTLFGLMDIEAVCLISLLLDESTATTSANVVGGVSNEPFAVIAMIAGAGIDVVFCISLQSHPSLCSSVALSKFLNMRVNVRR